MAYMIKTPHPKIASLNWGKLLRLKAVKYPSIIIGAVILLCVLIFVFFPDPFINAFLKDRVTKAFTKANPTYSIKLGNMHYNIWTNRLGCDSIMLKTSDLTYSAASFSVKGISWIKVLRQSDFTPNIITSSSIEAQNIVLNFRKSQNELCIEKLHISVPDSDLVIDSVKYYPLIDDEQYFSKSQFRQTRFRFDIPHIQIIGLDCLALLQRNTFTTKNINIHDAFTDILVNMDKPYDKNSANPQMPNEFLASMKEIVKVDSLKIINGRLKYSERYAVEATPGVILINKINVSISGVANHTSSPDTAIIHGEGLFMNSGKMKLFMAIPLSSKNFSLQYYGSLSAMDATVLNAFIEPTEHHRIKSGILQSAKFNIEVNSGHASGTLRAEYKDISIASIDKTTGSEKGIFDRISSMFSKIFVIRGTNMPDEKGEIKIGATNYTRHPEDYFFQFVWFALRNGVADIVGFPPI